MKIRRVSKGEDQYPRIVEITPGYTVIEWRPLVAVVQWIESGESVSFNLEAGTYLCSDGDTEKRGYCVHALEAERLYILALQRYYNTP